MQFRQGSRQEELATSDTQRDHRPRTTGWVWFWATLMMGPSALITFATQSAVVPLFVIAGAALSSACVWAFGGASMRRTEAERRALEEATSETARLKAHVEEMEERLHSLETIRSYEQARREREEQARFGAPHEGAMDPSRDPLRASPPRANSAYRTRDGRVAEG